MISSVGFENLLWFIGRVESVGTANANAGSVKVRAYGIHPPVNPSPRSPGEFGYNDIEGVSEEHLPWAPIINGSGGGANLVPQKGELVIGFFIDGRDAQYPVVVGTFPGIQNGLPIGSGYDQFDDEYIKPSDEAIDNFGVHTGGVSPQNANSPSRSELEGIASKSPEGVTTGDGEVFYELDPVSGGLPDKNLVLNAVAEGSNIQVGGDGQNEHIVLQHHKGNHIQIDGRGNIKLGTNETAQTWARNIQYRADGSIDISAGENYSIHVENGNATIYVNGDINVVSRNDMTFTASGEMKFNAGEGISMRGSKLSLHALTDNIDLYADNKIKINSENELSIKSNASGLFVEAPQSSVNISGSNVNTLASGNIVDNAQEIHLRGNTVYVDDIVRMAENGASAITSDDMAGDTAVVPSSDQMPDPEGRVATTERTITHNPGDMNRSHIDDYEISYDSSLQEASFNGSGHEKGVEIACRLVNMGYSKAAASAIVGNIMVESDNFRADKAYSGEYSRGWLQWHNTRRDSFEAYASTRELDITSDAANFGYMLHELDGREGNHWSGGGNTQQFKTISDVDTATRYFMDKYVRPHVASADYRRRLDYAKRIYETPCSGIEV